MSRTSGGAIHTGRNDEGNEVGVSTALAAVIVAAVAAAIAGSATITRNVDVGTKHASDAVERQTLPIEAITPSPAGVRTAAKQTARTSAFSGMHTLAATAADPPIGTNRVMPILDQVNGVYRFRQFTLRAIGQHIEVWVQRPDDLQGPAWASPRGLPERRQTQLHRRQLPELIDQFDTNILPKESATFSVPATATAPTPSPDRSADYSGDGDKIVCSSTTSGTTTSTTRTARTEFTYIAGFFSAQFNDFFDRNVMTIDAFDWLHRTGANPPDDPSSRPCTSAPARPSPLRGRRSPTSTSTCSSTTRIRTRSTGSTRASPMGADAHRLRRIRRIPIDQHRLRRHIQCFLGWLAVADAGEPEPAAGGPENSLTRWSDQGDGEILADYGAAYSIMELLQSRYGTDFMTALHRDDGDGLVGLQDVLDAHRRTGRRPRQGEAQDVLHDWSLLSRSTA